ncbi:MAG: ABC transporter permease [Candidatus Saganbacteria bacterium]|nr:ABC transporter permease [Candidatus Saganbacteria bacterium]
MKFAGTIKMSFRNIMAARMRSFLTMLGVIIGIFSVISLVNLGLGLKAYMYNEVMGFGTGATYLEIHAGKEGQIATMGSAKITYQDAKAISKNCPSVTNVDPRIVQSAKITYGDKTFSAPFIMGVTPAFVDTISWQVGPGRFLSDADVDMRKKVCVLGQDVAKNLFGEFSAIGEKVKIKGNNFVVIGVMAEKGGVLGFNYDEFAIIPTTTAEDVFKVEKLGEIGAVAKSAELVPQAIMEISEVLEKRHGRRDFRIDTQENSLAMLDSIMTMLTALVAGIAAISLLVGGIGIANIMLVSVTERTREIGIRKAVGAKAYDIMVQFLAEALIIGLIGGIIGIFLGVFLSSAIMLLIGLPPSISFGTIFLATFVSIIVGVISGVYPAWRAASLDPVEALRYE